MKPKRRSEDTIGRGLRQAIEWTLVAVAGAVLLVSVVIPKVAGATPYTVLTGSMKPTMPPGTLVVVRAVDPRRIVIGDVVTYQPTADASDVITHRVVAQGADVSGEPVFETKGDANPVPDPVMVRADQIVGERWYYVPYVGYVSRLLTGEQRTVAVRIAIGGLLLYALAMFAGEWRDRYRRRARRRPGRHAHA